MTEKDLQVFIDSVTAFFEQQVKVAPEVDTPYLNETRSRPAYDYTGMIGISGSQRGCIYFSAPSAMLRQALLWMGETDVCNDNLADLAGEIANTISGNARTYFGKDFMISVPLVVAGTLENVRLPAGLRSFVIPIRWQKWSAMLVITIESSTAQSNPESD